MSGGASITCMHATHNADAPWKHIIVDRKVKFCNRFKSGNKFMGITDSHRNCCIDTVFPRCAARSKDV